MTKPKPHPIAEIVADDRLQTREALDLDALAEYAEAYAAKAPMPPVSVYEVDGALLLVDGYHRHAAAVAAGLGWIEAVVVGRGSWEEAEVAALGANRSHGVRRSIETKRRVLARALNNPILQEQSSREIARVIGVSHDFVARRRKRWEAEHSTVIDDSFVAKTPATTHPVPTVGTGEASCGVTNYAAEWHDGAPEPAEDTPLDDAPPSVLLPPWTHDLERLARTVMALRREAVTALGRYGEPTHQLAHRVRDHLTDAATALSQATPEPCPQCSGAGCRRCGGHGWIEAGRRTRAEAAE